MLPKNQNKPEFRRMAIDVAMQVELGRFFGAKFRCGVLYGIFEQSGDRKALEEAVKMYQKARDYWATLANIAKDVYKTDVNNWRIYIFVVTGLIGCRQWIKTLLYGSET